MNDTNVSNSVLDRLTRDWDDLTPEAQKAARYVLEKFPDTTKVQGINQNYAWGQDSWRDFSTAFGVLKKEQMVKDGLSAPVHDGAMKYYKEAGLR